MNFPNTFEIFLPVPHRVITDSPPAGPLLLGHFDRRGSYSGWRPEGTRDWLLIYTVAGSGTVTTTAGVHTVEAGHALLYLPDTPHDYRIGPSGRWELRWAHFIPPKDWLELLHWPELAPAVLRLVVQETGRRRAVETALQRALQLSRRHLRRGETFALNALHEALLWCDVENPGAGKPRLDERVRRALDYITHDPRRVLTLDAVAKASGLSVSRLSELFKSQIGVSPRQYWERHRIEHARQLLERTDLTVAEVADATGFTDPFYFSTRFSALVGRSPRAHRQHPR